MRRQKVEDRANAMVTERKKRTSHDNEKKRNMEPHDSERKTKMEPMNVG